MKKAVDGAKNDWVRPKCKQMNDGTLQRGTGQCWKALGEIKRGLSKTSPTAEKMMTKANGTKCTTAEENAEVFRIHFVKLFDRRPEFTSDFSTLPEVLTLEQRAMVNNLAKNAYFFPPPSSQGP